MGDRRALSATIRFSTDHDDVSLLQQILSGSIAPTDISGSFYLDASIETPTRPHRWTVTKSPGMVAVQCTNQYASICLLSRRSLLPIRQISVLFEFRFDEVSLETLDSDFEHSEFPLRLRPNFRS